tara:strand:+ start:3966 stop:4445 length:480 start_codon:yes stop_codon:yes gene_type:complete
MELVSSTKFILKTHKSIAIETSKGASLSKLFEKHSRLCFGFATFIGQRVTKGMFVPCDEDGNFLKEPIVESDWWKKIGEKEKSEYRDRYEEAKGRVLFEGNWEYSRLLKRVKNKDTTDEYNFKGATPLFTIESLANKNGKYLNPLLLTKSALKQIGYVS